MNKSKKNYMKDANGITLIALVVTIIILLILAGVSINLVLGENGIIQRAKQSKVAQTEAEAKEKVEMLLAEYAMEREYNNKTLLEFLEEKKSNNEIDEVINNEDGTYTIEVDEYEVTINEKKLSITDIGKLGGIKPEITLTTNTQEIQEEIIIQVKVTTSDGTIISVTKPDGTTTDEVEFNYPVTENKKYTFKAEGSNGRKTSKSIEITNVKETAEVPIIESNYGYPILKATGIELGGTTTITYDTKEGLENLYSIDNGVTWNKYTGPFTIVSAETIKAKSMKNGKVLSETSISITLPTDAMGINAYDTIEGYMDTYTEITRNQTGLIKLDSSVIGKKVYIKAETKVGSNNSGKYNYIRLLDKDKNILSTVTYKGATIDEEFDIIENTEYLCFYSGDYTNNNIKIYNVAYANEPIIKIEQVYPIINSNIIEQPYNIATIEYDNTSIQKLYKINDGDWKVYTEQPIRLAIGETLYAKGKDKNGKETIKETSYNSILPSDALGLNAYDTIEGYMDTYAEITQNQTGLIKLDSSVIGKKVYIKAETKVGSNNSGKYNYIRLLDKDKNILSTVTYKGATIDEEFDIVENTEYLCFYSGDYTNNNIKIYNVIVSDN